MNAIELEQIIPQLRPQMMRVALDFFHHQEDAEDAVQEVLLRMWRRQWKPDDDVTALAIRATKNQCVTQARRNRLRQHLPIDDTPHPPSTSESDQPMLTREREMMIELAISTLTRSEQRLIRLRQQDGLDAKEIATLTGIPLASVRSMLSMARKKLINKLRL